MGGLTSEISHVTTPALPIINLLAKSPDSQSGLQALSLWLSASFMGSLIRHSPVFS